MIQRLKTDQQVMIDGLRLWGIMTPEQAAAAWGLQTTADDSPDQGLINKTYVVGNPPQYILQWVNPIFSPLIHNDLIPIIAHARN